jgi:hypothetical protein
MGVDPGLGSPLVREDEDSTVEVIGLTGQLDMMDGGTWGMA